MNAWKDSAIERHLAPLVDILSSEVDPNFSKIEFVAWFEPGVHSHSYRVFDADGNKVRLGPSSSINDREGEIRSLTEKFRSEFVKHGEPWVAMYVRVEGDGTFELNFDYDDPYKFDFRNESVR